MGKKLLLFIQSFNIDTYINALTHNIRHEDVDEVFFACPSEMSNKKVNWIDFINRNLRHRLEELANSHSEYIVVLDHFPKAQEVESHIIWILFVKPHDSVPEVRKRFPTLSELIVDVTACNKRLATDVVTSFIASNIPHVAHFELADRVYSKEWNGSKMYHDLVKEGIRYYSYDNFSAEGSTSFTINGLKSERTASNITQRAVLLLSNVKRGIEKIAKRHVKKDLWVLFLIYVSTWVVLAILTWKYSWNVMEPWTYFIGGVSTIVMTAYFVITQKEFAPNHIYKKLVESRTEKYMQEASFDLNEYRELRNTISTNSDNN